MREIEDESGRSWEAVAVETVGAHRRMGAKLGFRPADDREAEPLVTPITFNSDAAAEFAITTMSEKELRRRLEIARSAAGRW